MGIPTPDSLVKPFGDCLVKNFNATGFNFPKIGEPGMPPLLMGAIGAMLGPAAPILNFIPPKPESISDIQKLLTNLPSIVIEGFKGAAKGLPALPFEVMGIKVQIPGVEIPGFDPKALIDLIVGLITAPIKIFTGIIESLIKLAPKFPDLDGIKSILSDALKSVGIPKDVLPGFIGCLATSFFEIIKAIIP